MWCGSDMWNILQLIHHFIYKQLFAIWEMGQILALVPWSELTLIRLQRSDWFSGHIFFKTCSLMKRRASGRCFKTRISQSCYLIPSDELEPGLSSAQRESTPHELLPNIISAISPLSWTSEHGKCGIRNEYLWISWQGFWDRGIHFHVLLPPFFCIPTEFLTHLCVKLGSSSSITIQIIHCELWRAAEKN